MESLSWFDYLLCSGLLVGWVLVFSVFGCFSVKNFIKMFHGSEITVKLLSFVLGFVSGTIAVAILLHGIIFISSLGH